MYRTFLSFKIGLILTALSAGVMFVLLFSHGMHYTTNQLYPVSLVLSATALTGYGLMVRARRLALEQIVRSE
ncbi:hypothetical protein KC799_12485 [candidate division KSB1 bacterium]|nr:hypothetical protein [candidate division KSB1 bacterium]